MPDLIHFGSDVKMKTDGTVEGYLVLFGSADEADFVGDYFTKSTDFDLEPDGTGRATLYFNHGLDPVIGTRKLNHGMKAELSLEDKGVWIQGKLDEADEYDAMVIDLIRRRQNRGKAIGWSSGTLGHLMQRHEVKSGIYEITKWPLASDASLTHTPADYRNQATYKTIELLPVTDGVLPASEAGLDESKAVQAKDSNGADNTGSSFINVSVKGVQAMSEEQNTEAQPDEVQQIVDSKIKNTMSMLEGDLAEYRAEVKGMSDTITRLLTHMEDSPTIRKSGYYTQDGGKSDPDVKSLGDFMLAIARRDTVRLESVYGSSYYKAQTGDSGAAGGYQIPEIFDTQFMTLMNRTSQIINAVTKMPVSVRSGRFPSLDVTTAPSAGVGESAEAGGVGANVRAEGGAYTEETASIDQIRFDVSDAASGYLKASKELVQEAQGVEALLRTLGMRSMTEKTEHYILRGSGASVPQGILGANCAIGIAPDSNNVFADTDMAEMITHFKTMMGSVSDIQSIQGGVWIIHRGILEDIFNFETGTGGSVWNTNIAQGPTMVLDGRPIWFSEHMPAPDTSGCVLLADLPSYVLFELGGMYIDYSEHVDFLNGNVVWRFGRRIDGKPLLNGPITLADPGGSFTVSPFVYLND